MNVGAVSLRTRILVLILLPLLAIAAIAGIWRFQNAKATAKEVFDRNLLAITMAVSRDVAISGGDALSPLTRDLLNTASGGPVFYHVNGPDGSFISGYAYPPRLPATETTEEASPFLFDGQHQGEQIRAARLVEFVTIDGISGNSTVHVWQTVKARDAFANRIAAQAIAIMGALIATVFLVVWFGVRVGLKPLDNLQDAIALRHSEELRPIKRPVPPEVGEIVRTLNAVFEQVRESIASRDRFISDAAHQLRNPIAGILALAESVKSAPSGEEAKRRAQRVAAAAAHVARLSEQLLALERLRSQTDKSGFKPTDINKVAEQSGARNAPKVMDCGLNFVFEKSPTPLIVNCEPILLGEAIENLVDNALVHGGSHMTKIQLSVTRLNGASILAVEDDGKGIVGGDREVVFERFAQSEPGEGSGLGLAIVREIVNQHDGEVRIVDGARGSGARFEVALPLVDNGAAPKANRQQA